jgi:hypothetical protein
MARYKVLKSVAHNIGHSFTSLMNYAGDDYVMGHILRFARQTGVDTLTIDFVSGEAGPQELLADPISAVPGRYTQFFWDLVKRQGSDRSCVKTAILTLKYNLNAERARRRNSRVMESPYVCDVLITDIHDKNYGAHFQSWWYPEGQVQRKDKSPWWKLWGR